MIKCGGVIFYIISTIDWFRLLKLPLGSNLINFHYNSIVYLTIRKLDIPITNDLEKNDMYRGTPGFFHKPRLIPDLGRDGYDD